MQVCHIPIYLAYIMCAYIVGTVFYLIRTINMDTPFKKSLNPEQIKIKNEESNKRKTIFCNGIIFGCIILYIFQPFNVCMK